MIMRKTIRMFVLISLLALGFFLTPSSASFNPPFTEITGSDNPFDGVNAGNYSMPSFVDLDGDGDLDAFIGAEDGLIYYYQNTGTVITPTLTLVTGGGNPFDGVDVGSDSKPSFTDLDGDGDLDAFIGKDNGHVRYYRNDGDVANPSFAHVTGSGNPFDGVDVGYDSAPSFADLDGDGDLDAFVGESDGVINYYQNTGTIITPTLTLVTGSGNPLDGVDVGYTSTPSFADLDGDGDLDAFIGGDDGRIRYYRNDGDATSPSFTRIGGEGNPFYGVDVGNYSAPSFADLDGDGDLDAFIGEFDGVINYYRNAAAAASSSFNHIDGGNNPFNGVDAGNDSAPSFADLDGDGDLDAFIGEEYGYIRYYRNDGDAANPSFTHVTGIANPFSGMGVGNQSMPIFADLDADGDLDGFVGEHGGNINYFRNDGDPASPSFTEITGSGNPFDGVDVGYASAPSFADLDGDGDLDAFIGRGNGCIRYYRNDGDATSPSFTEITGSGDPFDGVDVGTNSTPSFADLDEDGDLDAFVGESDGNINYYRNDGDAAGPSFTHVTGSGNPLDDVNLITWIAPTFANLDGDGDLDACIGFVGGRIKYYRNNRAPQVESPTAVVVTEDAPDSAVDLWPAFQDPDHTPVSSLVYTVTANTNPALFSSVSITGGQYLNLDYVPDANGAAALTLQATDPEGLWITTTLEATVTAVNDPPAFVKGPDCYVLEDSGPASYPAWATTILPGPADESSQVLTFALESDLPLFAALSIDPTSGELSFTTAADAWGTATITATLQDNGGTANGGVDTSTPQTFQITTFPVNDAPAIDPIPDPTVVAGTQITLTVTASDVDLPPQTLTFSLGSAPAGAAITPGGDFSWTPTEDQGPGDYPVTVFVSDDGTPSAFDTETFTITVTTDEYFSYLPLVVRE